MTPEIIENRTEGQWRPIRLATLIRLRWLGIAGQSAALLTISFGLHFPAPLAASSVLIGLAAALNVGLQMRFGSGYRLSDRSAALILAFDCLQLSGLLWLTGGLENPFSILLLAPVSVSATTLNQRLTAFIAVLAASLTSLLAVSHLPLPWTDAQPIELDQIFVAGNWIALLLGIGFVAAYTNRVAHEARQLADALAATELMLSRQQQLRALDGLAAAAAHELGTPLATIAIAASEMRADPTAETLPEDLDLILEQIGRCRAILGKLRSLGTESDPFSVVTLGELLAEVTRPYEQLGKTVLFEVRPLAGKEPLLARNVGLIYGLGNLVENAVHFARQSVCVITEWDETEIRLAITDDGPGFPPDLIARLGEPYITTRPRELQSDLTSHGGLGLGVFIAKTLIERTGARLAFLNADSIGHAEVRIVWQRSAIVTAQV